MGGLFNALSCDVPDINLNLDVINNLLLRVCQGVLVLLLILQSFTEARSTMSYCC